MSPPEDDIRAVLDESGPGYNGFTFEIPGGGHQSDVYMVTLDHGGEDYEVVLKFKPDGDIPFDIEPKLHEYVANRTDVPVPRILVFKQEPGVDVRPYFVTERVHGENLSQEFASLSSEDRDRVERVLLDANEEAAEFYEVDVVDGEVDSFANLKALVRATRAE